MGWMRRHFWFTLATTSFLWMVIGGYLGCSMRPQLEYGVKSAPWMPPGATNGACFNYGAFTPVFLREFDISEADFVRYAQSKAIILAEIREPVLATRYYAEMIAPDDPRFSGHDWSERLRAHREFTTVRVTSGLQYRHQFEDQLRHYLYDRERGRAFVEIHTR